MGRSASTRDLAMNASGIVAGTLFHSALNFKAQKTLGPAIICVAASLAIMLISFRHPIEKTIALILKPSLPVIENFDAAFAENFINAVGNTSIALVPSPDRWIENTSRVARVEMTDGQYPGIQLIEVPRNWDNYSSLAFEIFNLQPDSISLALRIHDADHDNQYEDRFNRKLTLLPGLNSIKVSLVDIRSLGDSFSTHRQMDMKRISNMSLFALSPVKPLTVYLDNVRLE